MNLSSDFKQFHECVENHSPLSFSSSLDEFFFPAGSLSSKEYLYEENPSNDLKKPEPNDSPSESMRESSHTIIEYFEYKPLSDKKNDSAKFQSVSLCASPEPKENSDNKFSQTQEVEFSKLLRQDFLKFSGDKREYKNEIDSEETDKYKLLCENYEKQNKILGKEVQDCAKQISKLMKQQEKIKKNYSKATEEASKAKSFLMVVMESLGEILEEKLEYPTDEHSYNFIASQIQLLQARIARKQALLIKLKSSLEAAAFENKDSKRQISELSSINSHLNEKLDKKKAKIKELKKLLGKASERYSEETDSRINSSNVSKSSTPLSDDMPKTRVKNMRTHSAKDSVAGDKDCYRDAMRDLKDLSERAKSKISETQKKLSTIPKGAGKTGPKALSFNEATLKSPGYIKYYRN